ncbi:MAG: VacJ family lipoprotein [Geminicoccaceae bacterium]|nr:VacJ family lipoprotein [Geminicoccaceae bacterium]
MSKPAAEHLRPPDRRWTRLFVARPAAVLVLAACLWAGHARAQEIYDPIEPVNRAIFAFNQVVDGLILDPAQQIYGYVVPEPAKRGVRNFLSNLAAPIIFVNDLLQGERERAGVTLGRFMINTTLGLGGIFDFASIVGMEPGHDEDFGQTLAVYGVSSGPFIMLPILGPSGLRDVTGTVVDAFVFNPWPYYVDDEVTLGVRIVDGVDTRYRIDPVLDDLEANSLDLYAAIRSGYLQRREADIRNGASPAGSSAYEDIFDQDFDDEQPLPSDAAPVDAGG